MSTKLRYEKISVFEKCLVYIGYKHNVTSLYCTRIEPMQIDAISYVFMKLCQVMSKRIFGASPRLSFQFLGEHVGIALQETFIGAIYGGVHLVMKLRENFDTDAMEYNLFWDETDGNKTRTSAYLGNR